MARDYIEEMWSEANWGNYFVDGEWVMYEYPPSEKILEDFCKEYLVEVDVG